MRVCDNPTSLYFHFNWDNQLFLCIDYHITIRIGQVIAYLNPKLLALVWVYRWFSHPISKPQALSKLQYYHILWIKFQISNTCAYRYINLFCIFWEEWRHSSLLRSEWYRSKVGSKTMGISMIFHFSGRCPTNNLVLVFMYFIYYPTVAYIDVKYRPLYIFLR